MLCNLVETRGDYSVWEVISKHTLEKSLQMGFPGLYFVAAIGDTILLHAQDKYAVLTITNLNQDVMDVEVSVDSTQEKENA